ncbi:MAG TPA: proline dehydrogenase family protein [Candidatus Acidoferrales bacterium]|nr:proline dehydrogenase family protein [Candidatus Acidoferrales bacterium]
MSWARTLLLKMSENHWLRERAPQYSFVKRSVSRFMPGESAEDAFRAVRELSAKGISSVLTAVGENVADRAEAEAETAHYENVLGQIWVQRLPAEISVKLTHLGLDLDKEFCFMNLSRLIGCSPAGKTVWIDMEQSSYVDRTLELYRRAREQNANAGVCLQAYLRRTEEDVRKLLPLGGAIRLVKGAYNEPADVAFPSKSDVDENYFRLAQTLLGADARRAGLRAAIATHDTRLIGRIQAWALADGLAKEQLEFQMLYGIQRAEQVRLAAEGYRSIVLVAYGKYWFPWYMRRLAERPANVWFLARNLFAR